MSRSREDWTEDAVAETIGVGQPFGVDEQPVPKPGEHIGHFTVIKTLGRGGMGVVLLGYDSRLDRRVAIKLIDPVLSRDPKVRARFMREARALGQVNHPNLVHVYEVGSHEPHLYIVMEYVEGESLARRLESGPLPWREAVRIFHAAGRGLVAAHDAGLVHRDFKPANLLLGEDGRARVADFGIARVESSTESEIDLEASVRKGEIVETETEADALTDASTVLGTPAYMAPEQQARGRVDARADQYAFCVSLWEAIVGQRPFSGSRTKLLSLKQDGAPELPVTVDVPRWLRRTLARGLSPRPQLRFESMGALLSTLAYERPRQRLVIGAVVGVTAIAATGLVVAPRDSPCQGADDLSAVWGDDARSAVANAFAKLTVSHAADTAEAVERRLDAYADGWRDMARDACEATHVQGRQSDLALDLRMACLARHRSALEAAVEVLRDVDREVAKNATRLVSELPRVAVCGDVERLSKRVPLPDDDAMRVEAQRIAAEYEAAEVLQNAGQLDRARARLEPAIADARALGWQPLVARGLVHAVGILDSDPKAAEEAARAAIVAAGAGRDVRLEARAWRDLIFAIGVSQGRPEEAESLLVGLHAAVAALGPDDPLIYHAVTVEAVLAYEVGDYPRAAELYRHARDKSGEFFGPDDPESFALENNLGTVLLFEGRMAEALEQFERALTLMKRALGPRHPAAAEHHMNIGVVYLEQGEHEQALEPLRRSIELLEEEPELNRRRLAVARTNYAAAVLASGDVDAADRIANGAEKELEAIHGSRHPTLAAALHLQGMVATRKDDLVTARRKYERTLEILDAVVSPDHPNRAIAFVSLAELRIDSGDLEGLLEPLTEAADAIHSSRGDEPVSTLAGAITLADAVLESGSVPRERDLDLVRLAIDRSVGDLARAHFVLTRHAAAEGSHVTARAEAQRAHDHATKHGSPALLRRIEAWQREHR